ncbi:UDP-N-acetylglucosamine 4,6-dehydratase (inverting), partial [Candidatus Pelagibacter sp.]|nr:UDP-N-acetylglucosamine 4,6-dehydratase (inverting) [Candidatus Pelagibacter sp.]
SFGKNFLKYLLSKKKKPSRIVIYSRDELKQFEMMESFSEKKYSILRYFIGDIRDLDRLKRAIVNVDIVVHAAALKQVPTAEYNPFEVIKTNVIGAQNIVEACLDPNSSVKKVIALSTDKAAAPINLYGASKLCSDKLIIAANNIVGKKKISFSVVRYGNVMGSRGSVIPKFIEQSKKNGVITITDPRMTRFNITMQQSIKMVEWSIINCLGGEVIVPKIPSMKVVDLACAISKKSKIKYVGIRAGEKIHEDLITSPESYNTIDIGKYYVILPQNNHKLISYYLKNKKGKKVTEKFSYNSYNNTDYLSVNQIKKLLVELDII